MSGGSLDYFFCKIADVRGQLRHIGRTDFVELIDNLLEVLEDTMHDLEWWWSGDKLEGDFILSCVKNSKKIEETATRWMREANSIIRVAERVLEKSDK